MKMENYFAIEDVPSNNKVITRGHLNAQNRNCNYRKDFIRKNVYYDYGFKWFHGSLA